MLTISVFRTWSAAFLFSSHTSRKNIYRLHCFLLEDFVIEIMHIICRYMLAEGLGLSGIVSIPFTGMVSTICTLSYYILLMLVLWLCVLTLYLLFPLRLWSIIPTPICQITHSALFLLFFIYCHHWLKHLCKNLEHSQLITNWKITMLFVPYWLFLNFFLQLHLYGLWYCHGRT